MNWFWIILVAIIAIALITFVIKRNLADKRELENKLNQDYQKPPETDVNDPNVR
jgi:flagellar biosynthesis/type III secretory pathway M-ring protein FliF/YscJ